jgi:hypothetical protein
MLLGEMGPFIKWRVLLVGGGKSQLGLMWIFVEKTVLNIIGNEEELDAAVLECAVLTEQVLDPFAGEVSLTVVRLDGLRDGLGVVEYLQVGLLVDEESLELIGEGFPNLGLLNNVVELHVVVGASLE